MKEVVTAVTAAAEKRRLTLRERKARAGRATLAAVDAVYLSSRGALSAWWRVKTIAVVKLGMYPDLGAELIGREVLRQVGAMNEVIATLNDSNRLLEQISEKVNVNNKNDEAVDMKLAALNTRLKLIEDMASKVGSDGGEYVQ